MSQIKKIIPVLLFLLASVTFASETVLSNTGFIKSGLWYSKDPFFDGDNIRIYTIVFNGSEYDLKGEVFFEDNGKVICKGSFASTVGRTQEIWCDWKATKGEHKITARIVNPKISPIGEALRSVILDNYISGVSERVVDIFIPTKNITTDKNENSTTSVNVTEQKIEQGLNAVRENVNEVVPKEITKEDIDKTKEKIVSYIPESIKNKADSFSKKTGLDKLKDPFSYVIDFFIASYKFIINDPILIIILGSLFIWEILKFFYKRTSGLF